MSSKWNKTYQLVLLFVGTYGERIFVALHAFICNMNPDVFSFICLAMVFAILTEIPHKN